MLTWLISQQFTRKDLKRVALLLLTYVFLTFTHAAFLEYSRYPEYFFSFLDVLLNVFRLKWLFFSRTEQD